MTHSLPGFVIIRPNGQLLTHRLFTEKDIAQEWLTNTIGTPQQCAALGMQVLPATASFSYQLPLTKDEERAHYEAYEEKRVG